MQYNRFYFYHKKRKKKKKEKRKKRKQENGRKRKERKKHRALLTGQSFWDASCVVLTKSISVCIRWVTHDPYIWYFGKPRTDYHHYHYCCFLKLFNITLFCDWGKKLTKKRTGWDSYQRTDKKNSKDYRMKGTEMFDLQYSNKWRTEYLFS